MARDVPVRVLQWASGLLPADRAEWGQAMLGELDRIDGSPARWRFTLSCVTGVLVPPPRGLVAPMAVLGTAALGSAVVFSVGFVHFGLATNPWNWILVAILAAVLLCSIIGVSVQLRRSNSALLGLIGGLIVAASWLWTTGFTFAGVVTPVNSVGAWSGPTLMIAVPLVVGVGAALLGGNASVGRRAARLAGVSAGLTMFFIATIAVVAIDGGPRDPGATLAGGVSEAFFSVAMLYLISVPLATTAVGWVAATSTNRIRLLRLASGHQNSSASDEGKSVSDRLTPFRVGAVVAVLALGALVVLAR